ncbi:MAG: hypothetical protein JSW41_02235 [Candidatus Aenigmatarchaeota archaeon]|nr:MAG: hypothetical protein JSW41_02235 [Candidatus Aenigmarchaeota archaeon]
MKKILLIAILFIILISGCATTEEGRAISLASQTTEGQFMIKYSNALNKAQ